MSERRWVSRVYGLLTDGEGRVLLLGDGDARRLPYVEVEGTDDELPVIREALATELGIQTVVVRSVERALDEESRLLELALELEQTEAAPATAPGAAWLTAEEAAAMTLPARDRALLERLAADRPAPERPSWARRGWFAEAAAWIEDALAEHGRRTVGSVEQTSNWCLSSILRAPTEEGRVFLKATARSPLFVEEGTVTRGLAEIFPENIPRTLAIDAERRWMLLDDFGPVVGWKASLETRVEVLSLYARMQLATAGLHDELLALGLFDRRSAWLAGEIDSLLQAPEALGLDDGELKQLQALAPRFGEACARLAAGPVPDTLVHGDLHLGNVAGGEDGYVFFDWTDACVAHPFLDLLAVLFEEDGDTQVALRDAYLGAWAELASEDELLEQWGLAEPLASLNQAVSYRSILEHVEAGTAADLEPMLPYWLRKALAAESVVG